MSSSAPSTASATAATPISAKRKSAEASSEPTLAAAANVTPPAAASAVEQGVDTTGLCPYDAKIKLIKHHAAKAEEISGGEESIVIISLSDNILNLVPGKLDELEVECPSELSESELRAAYDGLSQEQVDKYHHLLVVPESVSKSIDEHARQIQRADRRFDGSDDDDDSDGPAFLMFNTHSSYLMMGVIEKQLSSAVRALNKAIKAVKAAESSGTSSSSAAATSVAVPPGVAKDALRAVFAAAFACDVVDHWRHDTESPEDVEKVGKKIEKLFRDLLWFTDDELGICDPYTRRAALRKLDDMDKDWRDDCSDWASPKFGIKVRTAKNGQGLGRPGSRLTAAMGRGETTAPQAAKKAKTTAGAPPSSSTTGSNLTRYLSAIDDKLKQRVKTTLQLKIVSASDPTKSVLVVVSGATCMKKMNQICAYLTGHDTEFQYHSQKGKCGKGSRIELTSDGETLWLAEKSAAKKATAAGASHLVDKGVKVVQIFQGINVNSEDGIFFDSGTARDLAAAAAPGSVSWVSSQGERYHITVQCIVPKKVISGKEMPLPRIVSFRHNVGNDGEKDDDSSFDYKAKTGFGMNVYNSNEEMQGDRQPPQMWFLGSPSQSEIRGRCANFSAQPLCREDGSGVDRVSETKSKYAYLMKVKRKDVETAGLPSGGGVSARGASFAFNNGPDGAATIRAG